MINEGSSVCCPNKKDVTCVEITMNKGKVTKADFKLPTKKISTNWYLKKLNLKIIFFLNMLKLVKKV